MSAARRRDASAKQRHLLARALLLGRTQGQARRAGRRSRSVPATERGASCGSLTMRVLGRGRRVWYMSRASAGAVRERRRGVKKLGQAKKMFSHR